DRLRRVGYDEIHVELDDVAEAVARRTGAERVVERKQPRLRIFVRDAALPAFEALGEDVDSRLATCDLRQFDGPCRTAALQVGGLDRVGEPLTKIRSVQLHAIDDGLQHRAIAKRLRLDVFDRDGAAVDEQTGEPFLAQRADRRADRRDGRGGADTRVRRHDIAVRFVRLLRQLVDLGRVRARDGRLDNRYVEADQQAGARWQLAELRRDDFPRFPPHLAPPP